MTLVALMVLLAWIVCYGAGGSQTVAPHIFYVPVILAAVRFGPWGALAAGLAAGFAAGPLLPLDVAAGTSQEPLNWGLRAGAFILIGELAAFLTIHSRPSIRGQIAKTVMRRDLRHALDARHLHVQYQPIVDLSTRRIVGAEALVRWTDPDRGPRYPDEFIPLIEDAGLAHLVSDFMLDEVSHQLREWRSIGLIDADTGFKLAINVSGTELQGDRLENKVRDTVIGSRIPAAWIHLEVTETALIDDLDVAVRGLQRLRGVGVRLAIDDFGTGESSLRYLHRFPVNTVKIDRSFITALVDDERGRSIVAAVVSLASDMGLVTIAEGVETHAHAQILAELGCDMAQGYHFNRPLPPAEFERQLRGRTTRRT
ncbi:MAG: EAL domain-containing protein [Acidimicrobiales bacterium]|nr:EAL domain-containing protein [Acidimicrobiales bacterium]